MQISRKKTPSQSWSGSAWELAQISKPQDVRQGTAQWHSGAAPTKSVATSALMKSRNSSARVRWKGVDRMRCSAACPGRARRCACALALGAGGVCRGIPRRRGAAGGGRAMPPVVEVPPGVDVDKLPPSERGCPAQGTRRVAPSPRRSPRGEPEPSRAPQGDGRPHRRRRRLGAVVPRPDRGHRRVGTRPGPPRRPGPAQRRAGADARGRSPTTTSPSSTAWPTSS